MGGPRPDFVAPTDEPTPATGAPSPRTAVRRVPQRAEYDPGAIRAILGEAKVCHVGIATPDGPMVLPMGYGLTESHLILHGSRASRIMRHIAGGAPVCITVTHMDGLVMAKSWFHHSMNYRSVMVHGAGVEVTDTEERAAAMWAVMEHLAPGRAALTRGPNALEDKATMIVRIPLAEAAAKIRTGPPGDDPIDDDLDIPRGVVPMRVVMDDFVAC